MVDLREERCAVQAIKVVVVHGNTDQIPEEADPGNQQCVQSQTVLRKLSHQVRPLLSDMIRQIVCIITHCRCKINKVIHGTL